MIKSLFKMPYVIGILLLISTTNVLPLTIKSSLMVNPQSKKNVIMLNDVHYCHLKMVVDNQQRKTLSKINNHQKLIFNALGQALVNLDPEKAAQMVVITETGAHAFGRLFEEEAGAIGIREMGETLEILPRIFLHRLFEPLFSVGEKTELLTTANKPFAAHGASYVLNNNVRWVVADLLRNDQDRHLAFGIYKNWKNIITSINAQEELPETLAELTIGAVKQYITKLHTLFQEQAIVDPYYQKVVNVITTALATEKIHESDHFALLHKYLAESNPSERDEFNNNMICLISQKFDVELRMYLRAFEEDPMLNYAFIIAGGEHNQQMRVFLEAQGYSVVEEAGINDSTEDLVAAIQNKAKLTDLLKAVELNSPFVNMQEIVGINVREIAAPNEISYAKLFIKSSCVLGGCLGAFYFWKNQQKSWSISSAILGTLLAIAIPND